MKQTQKYLAEQERIARIAFKLFAETGYAKTPLSVIGKEAGVQKSLLQYYFPKKSKFIELFIETSFSLVIDQVIESIRAREAEEAAAAIDDDLVAVDPFDEEKAGLYEKLNEEAKDFYGQSITYLEKAVAYIDGLSDDARYDLTARTPGNRLVRLTGDHAALGQFRDVKITGANKWSLFGELV